jgi:GMP synthase-like glutamine amidotransferase
LVFRHLPKTFNAACVRADDILTLPVSFLPLANSERTQFQAFKVAGKPIYGVQFDPLGLQLVETFVRQIELSTATNP